MTAETAWVLLATVSPISELRGGIPLGILKYGQDPLFVFCIAVIANALLFFPLFLVLRLLYGKLFSRIPLFDRYLDNLRKRGEHKVEKYGFWGLFLFVAVPLPITGAYTGTILAWLLGMDWKKAFPAVGLGVIMAGVVVLLLTRLTALGIATSHGFFQAGLIELQRRIQKRFLLRGVITWTPEMVGNGKAGYPCVQIPSPAAILQLAVVALALPDSEHLGPAHGTHTLSGRPAVLHDYASGILHLPFGTALHTVCLHMFTSLLVIG